MKQIYGSSYTSNLELPTYQEEKDKLQRGWMKEQIELINKIKGSSLKQADIKRSLKSLLNEIIDEL